MRRDARHCRRPIAIPGGGHFEIRAGEPADYRDLWAALSAEGRMPAAIAHFWARGAWRHRSSARARAVLVAGDAQYPGRSPGTARLPSRGWSVDYSACRGFLRTLKHEHPGVLRQRGSGVEPADAVAVILAETSPGASYEGGVSEVRYEGGRRSVRSLEEFRPQLFTAPLREGGVYLITGAGGLGRVFADYLVKTFHAKVVLAGRSRSTLRCCETSMPSTFRRMSPAARMWTQWWRRRKPDSARSTA